MADLQIGTIIKIWLLQVNIRETGIVIMVIIIVIIIHTKINLIRMLLELTVVVSYPDVGSFQVN